ncbi:lamin tail domain-containing protein [Candidatus Amarolinea aalborgensis]|uniref:lamin tail domain-containing protein n=1 Tax=Candidatus Amarolinea aalborgensis TaxID=2249329 RepID=UPI003BFA2B18
MIATHSLPVASRQIAPAPQLQTVVINEVAWGGTAASAADEWMEIFNPGDVAQSLDGWTLTSGDGRIAVTLGGVLASGSYYLLERTDDSTVSDIPADRIYTGDLLNSGAALFLRDPDGNLIDSANGNGGAWPAGSGSPGYFSMERVDPTAPDSDGNWAANNGVIRNGHDANGNPLNGTPRQPNSAYQPAPTATPTPSATTAPSPTPTQTNTATPTAVATPTNTPTPAPSTDTPTPTPTATATAEATATATITAAPTPTATPTDTSTPPSSNSVVINEVEYDTVQAGSDTDYEWFELYNTSDAALALSGWRIGDNSSQDVIPDLTIAAHGFVIVAASTLFYVNYPTVPAPVIILNSAIGNGLGNSGDRLLLSNAGGLTVDGLSWGTDVTVLNPSVPVVPAGHSSERISAGYDTDTAADWVNRFPPAPGWDGGAVTPTPTLTPTEAITPTPTATSLLTPTPTNTPGATSTPTPTAAPTTTATPTDTSTPPSANAIVINEVEYDTVQAGSDTDYEWFELYNTSDAALALSGWRIGDNSSQDVIPDLTIAGHGFVIVAASALFYVNYPTVPAPVIILNSAIGNGLGNSGDRLLLSNAGGLTVDGLSWGTDATVLNPSVPVVPAGHSSERISAGYDTDTAADWVNRFPPAPGWDGGAVTPTPTATSLLTPTPTSTPGVTSTPTITAAPTATPTDTSTPPSSNSVVINEVEYDTVQAGSDTDYEWFELYNTSDAALTLSGWRIGDNSSQDVIPDLTIAAHGFVIVAASALFYVNYPTVPAPVVILNSAIGNGLGNSGDRLLLSNPGGLTVDGLSWGTDATVLNPSVPVVPAGHSSERISAGYDTDTAADWVNRFPPAPGWDGGAVTPTQTPTEAITPTPTATSLLTPTPTSTPGVTSTPTPTASPTATATPTDTSTPPSANAIVINEVEYDTVQAGSDTDYEWFELYNTSDTALALSGWRIGDNSSQDVIPDLTIAAHGFVIVAASALFYVNYPTVPAPVIILNSPIGNGLGNSGDRLLLSNAGGLMVDGLSWGTDVTVLNPSVPVVPAGHSSERISAGYDTDTAADWVNRFPPAPGWDGGAVTPTQTPTATPTPAPGTDTPTPTATATATALPPISLNEVLPAPFAIDWNGDGVPDQNDEWIELYNAGESPVNLEGWQLDDLATGGTLPYTIPAGRVLAPHGFALFFRSETGVALNNTGNEQVRLLAPGGIQVEDFWFANPDVDWSYSKVVDGGSVWTDTYPPSPGASNQAATPTPMPTPTLTPTSGPTPTATATPAPIAPRAVVINEVAWGGTAASSSDEWLELFNPGSAAISLEGWRLSDGGDITILLNGVLAPGAYFLLERGDDQTVSDIPADLIYSGALNNSGESLTLFGPNSEIVDTANVNGGGWAAGSGAPNYDSMERVGAALPDDDANWASNNRVIRNGLDANGNPLNGTPRQLNAASQSTPTPTPTLTPTSGPTPTATATPAPIAPRAVVINEVAWGGTAASSSDEWLELFNPGSAAISLEGWRLSDGGDITILLNGVLAPGAYFLLERGDDQTVSDIPADLIYSGALNNSGESLTLFGPNSEIVDTANVNGGGWAAGSGAPNYDSMERVGAALPDDDANWASNNRVIRNGLDANGNPLNGTPRQLNAASQPIPTPTTGPTPTPNPLWQYVRLNEFLAAPEDVDWNGDGELNEDDEYVELFNTGATAVDLGGWRFDDVANGGSSPFTFAPGTLLPASGFRVFFRSETGVALNNSGGDDVRLLAPDGQMVQSIHYATASNDQAWSALPDGSDTWLNSVPPSPGASNQPNLGPVIVTGAVYRGQLGDLTQPLGGVTVQLWAGAHANAWDRWLLNGLTRPDGSFRLEFPQALLGFPYYHVVEIDPTGLVSVAAIAGAGGAVVDPNWIAIGPTYGGEFSGFTFWDDEPLATPTALPPAAVLITEVEYDSIESGSDSAWEWLELRNNSDSLLRLSGWSLRDNLGADLLPTLVFTPGAYLILAADPAHFLTHYPTVTAPVIGIPDGQIGNGLGNTGDLLRLSDSTGRVVDALSWGDNRSVFDPPAPDVAPGHSLARRDPTTDTDTAADWFDETAPSPGRDPGPENATPTPTPTATPNPAWAAVRVNEFLPAPESVDWNGDGALNEDDEYIELFNTGATAVDLGGFKLDDLANGGSAPFTIPAGAQLPAAGFLVFFRSQTGVALNNSGGDDVRLLAPDGQTLQAVHYASAHDDRAWSALPDGSDAWSEEAAPSPGRSNCAEPGCQTPTPTPTATPDPAWAAVRVNEFLPAPQSVDWNGDGALNEDDEYIELFNTGATAVDLGGFKLDDLANGGSAPYTLPAGTQLAAHGFLVFFRSQTGVALNNSGGDDVRLLAPDGQTLQAVHYASSHDDRAWSALPDGSDAWSEEAAPSPGRSNCAAPGCQTPTPTPTATPDPAWAAVRVNEFLPAPQEVDWNGDGALNEDDEYVELFNTGATAVDLGGFKLDDLANGGSAPYTLPAGTQLAAHGFLVFFRSQTGVALNNSGGDDVRVLAPDGQTLQAVHYASSHDDRAWSALPDGSDAWSEEAAPSPGRSNCAAPGCQTPTPTPTATPDPAWAAVRVNEFLPAPQEVDWNGDGALNEDDEYVELFNTGATAVDLGGFKLDDLANGGSAPYTLPAGTQLAAHGFLVFFRSQTGVALNNSGGDDVRVLAPDGQTLQAVHYASSHDDRAWSALPDGSDAWSEEAAPSPGRSNCAAPGCQTPTPTPTATPDPAWAAVRVNEFLPAPESVDWNGDGALNEDDEYIELFNTGATAVDLGGFKLDDAANGGSAPFTIPAGALLPAHGFLVFFRSQTGVALNNSGGDDVRLLAPDGQTLQAVHYASSHDDRAWSALPDGSDAWSDGVPPTPGRSNCPDAACIPPTPTATRTATPTRTPTMTATPTPQGTPGLLRLGEVLYDGTTAGTEGDEFVELFNADQGPLDLGFYRVGDEETAGGSESMYRLPAGILLAPGQSIVIAKNAAAYRARFAVWPDFELRVTGADYPDSPETPNLARDTRWGHGTWTLANSGDEVLLLGPDDRVLDAVAFGNGDAAGLGLTGHAVAHQPYSLQRVGGADTDDLDADLRVALPSPGWVEPWPTPGAAATPWALPGGWQGLWGGLLAQSGYGDGEGSPAYVLARGQAAGLHFLALNDPLQNLTAARWQQTRAAANSVQGLLPLVGLAAADLDLTGIQELPGAGDLWSWAAGHPGALVSAPAVGWEGRSGLATDLVSLLETAPDHTGDAQAISLPFAQAWTNGRRTGLAPMTWAPDADWRIGVLAPELSAAQVLDALRSGRTWLTTDPTLGLALQAGSQWSGGLLSSQAPVSLIVHYADAETATLEVLNGGQIITQTVVGGPAAWALTLSVAPGSALWARAIQPDGDVAAASPLFVEGPLPAVGLRLNELMVAPRSDWNHDGQSNTDDEWIEVVNIGARPVNLLGWRLTDSAPTAAQASTWRKRTSEWLAPGQYTLFFRSETHISLNDTGDWIRLLDPQGHAVDEFHYAHSPGPDRTWARTLNGAGAWVNDMAVTIGLPNLPGSATPTPTPRSTRRPPTPTPTPIQLLEDIGAARTLPLNSRVVISGQVTAPLGSPDKDGFYVQAGRHGIRVEISGHAAYPSLALGDHVQVSGRLGTERGELKLRLTNPADLVRLSAGAPLAAVPLRTGALGEAWEGTLVRISGQVVRLSSGAMWLDDGSGAVRVFVPSTAPFKRPAARRGQRWTVTGVVSQYGSKAPFTDGYRLLPRTARDLQQVVERKATAVTATVVARGLRVFVREIE